MKTQIQNLLNIGRAALPRRRTTGRSSLPAFIAAALLLSTLNPQLSTCFAQGSLTPPGAPAPTMLTLSQIEPRTPISTAPFIITQPGSYYLTTNLVLTTDATAIWISTNNVTLDLMGFTISTRVSRGSGAGILLNGDIRDITIFNGHITGGNYPYLGYGITCIASSPINVHVFNISVSECSIDGIVLGSDNSTIVSDCTVHDVGRVGIAAAIVSRSSAYQCGDSGIAAINATDCIGYGDTTTGISAETANNCYGFCSGTSFDSDGIVVNSAQNCYGISWYGDGIKTVVANNCYGYTQSGGYGIFARTVNNCYGECQAEFNGIGIFAELANNSYGFSVSLGGYGLYGTVAIGCYGEDYSTESGYSPGIGLYEYIANSCYSDSPGQGPGGSIPYKWNMP